MVGRMWRHCGDGLPERNASRCVWGEGGRWGREIFRLLAVYNYWHKNRMALADEVREVVFSRVEDVVYPPLRHCDWASMITCTLCRFTPF